MSGDEGAAAWIVKKLQESDEHEFESIANLGAGYLRIISKRSGPFIAAAIGVQDVIKYSDVSNLFGNGYQPGFIVNVPSKAIWRGDAISFIHDAPAAFGKFGDLSRAAATGAPSTWRNKEYAYFETAFEQHSAVRSVIRLFDRKFLLERKPGLPDFTVVLVDAYDLSAEDIRNARHLYGEFKAALKMTSYGSVTTAAKDAASSIGAEALTLRELMSRLGMP
jgi:hypothetical protein